MQGRRGRVRGRCVRCQDMKKRESEASWCGHRSERASPFWLFQWNGCVRGERRLSALCEVGMRGRHCRPDRPIDPCAVPCWRAWSKQGGWTRDEQRRAVGGVEWVGPACPSWTALAWLDRPDTKDCYRTWLLGAWAEEMASAEMTLAVDLTTKLAWPKSAVRQGGDGG